jgi:hypothetical protein
MSTPNDIKTFFTALCFGKGFFLYDSIHIFFFFVSKPADFSWTID